MQKTTEKMYERLYECLAKITSAQEIKLLLDDLCTYTEVEHMAQRLHAAKLLLEGCTYQRIIDEVDISPATLSRVSRCIRHGSGGYLVAAEKIFKEEKDED